MWAIKFKLWTPPGEPVESMLLPWTTRRTKQEAIEAWRLHVRNLVGDGRSPRAFRGRTTPVRVRVIEESK